MSNFNRLEKEAQIRRTYDAKAGRLEWVKHEYPNSYSIAEYGKKWEKLDLQPTDLALTLEKMRNQMMGVFALDEETLTDRFVRASKNVVDDTVRYMMNAPVDVCMVRPAHYRPIGRISETLGEITFEDKHILLHKSLAQCPHNRKEKKDLFTSSYYVCKDCGEEV
jgi:hypothetical protein